MVGSRRAGRHEGRPRRTKRRVWSDYPPSKGLHVLKDHWGQKRYLEGQCRVLAQPENLALAIEATRKAAPRRRARLGYRINRPHDGQTPLENIGRPLSERRLEAALFVEYLHDPLFAVPELWQRLVAYQVPLFNHRARRGWGNIDLLGLTADGDPVLVELKTGESSDSPLHALLQASTYKVALEKNWTWVQPELRECLAVRQSGIAVPLEPRTWLLVLLAPPAYWQAWGLSNDCSTPGAWLEAYGELCRGMGTVGMPVRHAIVEWATMLEGETGAARQVPRFGLRSGLAAVAAGLPRGVLVGCLGVSLASAASAARPGPVCLLTSCLHPSSIPPQSSADP